MRLIPFQLSSDSCRGCWL